MTELYYPLRSLREGNWFKLICGASYQHLPAVRHLTLAYTLAGADCIDVAADPAVIASARDAIDVASAFGEEAQARGFNFSHRPLLMVSLNDGEDPHFRKAAFDPQLCPADCTRPCETICPAQAIVLGTEADNSAGQQGAKSATGVVSKGSHDQFQIDSDKSHAGEFNPKSKTCPQNDSVNEQAGRSPVPEWKGGKSQEGSSGVIDQRCYGCGRCIPICPSQIIYTRSYVCTPDAIADVILPSGVDALEIHTQVGRFTDFQRLWQAIAPWVNQLKLLAISCPDGDGLIDYLWSVYDLIRPLPCPLVWQTDGRPMSGDIGIGATRAAVKLAQKVLAAGLPGYVQLAGGTNDYTVMKLRATGLLKDGGEWESGRAGERENSNSSIYDGTQTFIPGLRPAALSPSQKSYVAGIAYGSYARVLLSPILEKLEQLNGEPFDANLVSFPNPSIGHLEEFPSLLWQAVAEAHSLVSQLKTSNFHEPNQHLNNPKL